MSSYIATGILAFAIGLLFFVEIEKKGDNTLIILGISIAIGLGIYFTLTSNQWLMVNLNTLLHTLYDL